MFSSHPALHVAGLQNTNTCAPCAVRMSGTAGTLAGRIANCTDAWVRNYGHWYDVIYVGNGYGWALDRGAFGEKIQQHLCVLKGFNVSTSERQIGSIRYDTSTNSAQSDSLYKIVSTSTVGRQSADPGNKMRVQVVDNPYKPGSPCILLRVRSLDPLGSETSRRAAVRVFGHGYNAAGQHDTNVSARDAPNMRYMDRMPRRREQWFAGAFLFGDQAGWAEGETESWANSIGTNSQVFGWQLHADDGTGGNINGPTSPNQTGTPTPNFSLWLTPTQSGNEANNKILIKRWRPQGPTKTDISVDWVDKLLSPQDGAMESTSGTGPAKLWDLTGFPLRTKWVGFVNRLIWSHGDDGVIQTWYNELDTYSVGGAPTQIINVAGRNDHGLGRHGVGYVGNAGGGRWNPQNRAGNPYLCFEIYNASTYTLHPSVTLRTVPIRNHDRNPDRSVDEYAIDLMSLLKAAVY